MKIELLEIKSIIGIDDYNDDIHLYNIKVKEIYLFSENKVNNYVILDRNDNCFHDILNCHFNWYNANTKEIANCNISRKLDCIINNYEDKIKLHKKFAEILERFEEVNEMSGYRKSALK